MSVLTYQLFVVVVVLAILMCIVQFFTVQHSTLQTQYTIVGPVVANTETNLTNNLKSLDLVRKTFVRLLKIDETSSPTAFILQNGTDKNDTEFNVTKKPSLHKSGKKRLAKVNSSVHLAVLQPTWVEAPFIGEQQVTNCDVPCFITKVNTVESLNQSDAVIFMLHDPYHSTNGPINFLNSLGVDPASVIKVGMSQESAANYPQQFSQISKYDIEFSYRQSSDVFYPYFKDRLLRPVPKWSSRKSAIAFVAHNCNSKSKREKLVKLLQNYVQVDAVSQCLHNTRWPKNVSRSDKIGLLERYKVYLAAENSISKDYVTEKVYDGLEAGAVPVYLGAPNVKKFVPTNSTVIVPAQFTERDVVKVAETIQKIFNDEAEYERWTSFKHHGYEEWFKKKFSFIKTDPLCRLCRRVISLKEGYDWDKTSQQIVWLSHQ